MERKRMTAKGAALQKKEVKTEKARMVAEHLASYLMLVLAPF